VPLLDRDLDVRHLQVLPQEVLGEREPEGLVLLVLTLLRERVFFIVSVGRMPELSPRTCADSNSPSKRTATVRSETSCRPLRRAIFHEANAGLAVAVGVERHMVA
jgi:hypothetical protein